MFRRVMLSSLDTMIGDLLPRRRKASARLQVLTVAALTIVAAVAVCLIALH
jgi:hypothetical protein